MATATLTFDLNDSDDALNHERCIKSTDMALVLWEVYYNSCRNIETYIDSKAIESPQEALDAYREAIGNEMNRHGIVIDKLIV